MGGVLPAVILQFWSTILYGLVSAAPKNKRTMATEERKYLCIHCVTPAKALFKKSDGDFIKLYECVSDVKTCKPISYKKHKCSFLCLLWKSLHTSVFLPHGHWDFDTLFLQQSACGKIVDRYVECEKSIIFMDMLLQEITVYRHILFNADNFVSTAHHCFVTAWRKNWLFC